MRWREVVLYIGEDLLTTSYLAWLEKESQNNRTDFTWPDTIGHDNSALNTILQNGLTDNHSHLNGSVDVGTLRWIQLMNNIGPYVEKPEFDKPEHFMDKPISVWEFNTTLTFRQWGIVAAAIRLLLFEVIHNKP